MGQVNSTSFRKKRKLTSTLKVVKNSKINISLPFAFFECQHNKQDFGNLIIYRQNKI